MPDSQRYPWNINLSKVYDSSVCSISARNSEATFVEKHKIKWSAFENKNMDIYRDCKGKIKGV